MKSTHNTPMNFDRQEYWHDRFTSEKAFEWLVPSAVFMDVLVPCLDRFSSSSASASAPSQKPRILQIGFGTSNLQNHLRQRGFLAVTNIDYEPLAIERGRQLEQEVFGDVRMRYEVADATKLDLPDKYDLVIDKSAADAISCGGDDGVLAMAAGVARCLAEGGTWVSLSYSQWRYDYDYTKLPFDVQLITKIPTPKRKETDPDIFYYCYELRPTK